MFAVQSLSIPAFVFLCVILIAGLAYGSYQLGKQLMKLLANGDLAGMPNCKISF